MLSQRFGLHSKLKMATTSRTRAYDPDLRWRMIYQRIVLELPFKTISKNLYVDVSTVRLTVESCSIAPVLWTNNSRQWRKLTEADQFLLLELVIERPGIYLHELRHELHASGTEASMATICRFLHLWMFKEENPECCSPKK